MANTAFRPPTVHCQQAGNFKTAHLRHPTVITTLSSLSSIFVSLSASLHFVKLLGLHSLDFDPSLKVSSLRSPFVIVYQIDASALCAQLKAFKPARFRMGITSQAARSTPSVSFHDIPIPSKHRGQPQSHPPLTHPQRAFFDRAVRDTVFTHRAYQTISG